MGRMETPYRSLPLAEHKGHAAFTVDDGGLRFVHLLCMLLEEFDRRKHLGVQEPQHHLNRLVPSPLRVLVQIEVDLRHRAVVVEGHRLADLEVLRHDIKHPINRYLFTSIGDVVPTAMAIDGVAVIAEVFTPNLSQVKSWSHATGATGTSRDFVLLQARLGEVARIG